jgi:hypothetical protein
MALAAGLLAVGGTRAAAQDPRCRFQIGHVDRTGTQQTAAPGIVNYYAGGDVFLYCQGTTISMRSDSVASYGASRTVEFIGHVIYTDTGSIVMKAERGTYYRDGDRWEARGNVRTETLKSGSTMTGPSLDYFRQVPGIRDTAELYAVSRPTIHFVPGGNADERGTKEPYVIVADRVRMKGDDRVWAGGKVTIDRSDFAARSDSLRLDTGAGSDGTLIGSPVLRGLGKDSFNLTGVRIDLRFLNRALDYVSAKGNGHAVSANLDLKADTIGLDLENQKLVQTLAWGDSLRPDAQSADYRLQGDSMAFDTPAERLTETRAFGRAWAGGRPDSVGGERDQIWGDTLVARFATEDSAGTPRTAVRELEARSNARSFYRLADPKKPGRPSLSYVRGTHILIAMKKQVEGVQRVEVRGQVEGVHLEPVQVRPDTTKADSTTTPKGTR